MRNSMLKLGHSLLLLGLIVLYSEKGLAAETYWRDPYDGRVYAESDKEWKKERKHEHELYKRELKHEREARKRALKHEHRAWKRAEEERWEMRRRAEFDQPRWGHDRERWEHDRGRHLGWERGEHDRGRHLGHWKHGKGRDHDGD